MRRIFLTCVAVAGLVGTAMAADPPPMSDEIFVDHGFRWSDYIGETHRCAIAMADTTALLAYMSYGQGGVVGYRRGLRGAEIDINRTFLAPNVEDGGPFDISEFDGQDWKLAYLSENRRSLWVHAIAPETLETTTAPVLIVGPLSEEMASPAITQTEDRVVVAWIERATSMYGRLRLTRLTSELEILDETPVQIAGDAQGRWISLAMSDSSGFIVYANSHQQLVLRPLTVEGLPEADPVIFPGVTVSWMPSFDICPFGEDWLLAWNGDDNALDFAVINSDGDYLHGDRIHANTWSIHGLVVAANDSIGIVAWRDHGSMSILAARVRADGQVLDAPAITLDDYSPREEWDDMERRNLDCAWTGESFLVLWNQHQHDYPLASPGSGLAWGEGIARPEEQWPVLAQWLTVDGNLLHPEPLIVSQISYPRHVGAHFTDGHFLILMIDGNGDESDLISMRLDLDGNVIGEPTRFDTPDRPDDWDIWSSDNTWIHGMVVRPWAENAAVVYGYMDYYNYDMYDSEETYVVWDKVSPIGELIKRHRIQVGFNSNRRNVSSFNIAPGIANSLVTYGATPEAADPAPPFVRANLTDENGETLRTWGVISDSACTKPNVVELRSGYLMAWLDGTSFPKIHTAIIRSSDPQSEVFGEALLDSFGVHGAPYLIPGPDQVLLVFPADLDSLPTPADFVIYAIHFDMDGNPIDAKPIPVCTLPGDQGNVQGIWDSNQYFLCWTDAEWTRTLYGGRIGQNGAVIDPDGFSLARDMGLFGRLASDPVGNVAVGYKYGKVRLIEDLIPLLDEGDDFWDEQEEPPVESDSAAVAEVQIGSILENPCTGPIRIDMEVPRGVEGSVTVFDCRGRRICTQPLHAGQAGVYLAWDGTLPEGTKAPAGLYFLRISAGGVQAVRRAMLLR